MRYSRNASSLSAIASVNWAVGDGVAPYGLSLPPAKTGEDHARYRALYDEMRPAARDTMQYANRVFKSLGATEDLKGEFFYNELICLPDVAFLACSPSLEYPRPDMPPTIKYIGGMPLKPHSTNIVFPEWWSEIQTNAALPPDTPERKKVILLSQGTVNIDNYGELIIPAIEALATRQDVIVIATLGKREEKLPHTAAIPENTKVIDYFPYDAILPLADLFIFNGGYGGFMHGVMNGTPMIFAGTAADKGEVAARAEWAGTSVNLRTSTPTQDMIRNAVDKILSDGGFKANAMKLKTENEAMDALGAIEEQIWEYTEF
jgi:UDP:flavonoid glycosyltransferase YjiC (YdhE family)